MCPISCAESSQAKATRTEDRMVTRATRTKRYKQANENQKDKNISKRGMFTQTFANTQYLIDTIPARHSSNPTGI